MEIFRVEVTKHFRQGSRQQGGLLKFGEVTIIRQQVQENWYILDVLVDGDPHTCEIDETGWVQHGPDHWAGHIYNQQDAIDYLKLWNAEWAVIINKTIYARVPRLVKWVYTYDGIPISKQEFNRRTGEIVYLPWDGPSFSDGLLKANAVLEINEEDEIKRDWTPS